METEIYVRQVVDEKGKESRTKFSVMQRYIVGGVKVALMKVEPLTGRMHQIRVHAAYLGHPLVGDKIYKEPSEYLRFIENGFDDSMLKRLLHWRHALHAFGLSLELSGGKLDWEITLADDLADFLAGATTEAEST